ncbi:MAG TPA: ATP-binding cassette domain-containing protein [Casimicrobiaceae bacterium]|nr:ATP-binding cassette domain-containing protein [Casimicrobiaceae bacterium]
MEGGIVVERVSHVYAQRGRNVHVLDDISLAIRHGQFVALVGPSGSGKTTLLDILSGLVPLQAGDVLVAGRAPHAGRPDTARMFARDALLPWLSAYQNVYFAARTRPGLQEREKAILTLLNEVGLHGFERVYPRQLSQGMRQRVALARTFSLQSAYVFLDEPFGALDAQTKLLLQDKLLALWERFRSTVVLVTHDLGEAVALSDRVIVMSSRPGRILADVTIDLPRPRSVRALQTRREYHEIYSRLWRELERAAGMTPESVGAG